VSAIKANVKSELDEEQPIEAYRERETGFVTLNQTAELCRTLGDFSIYVGHGILSNFGGQLDIKEDEVDEEKEERRRGK
jgi:hypothetical protein